MDSNLTIIWLCNSMCTDFRRCGEIDEEMKQKLNTELEKLLQAE